MRSAILRIRQWLTFYWGFRGSGQKRIQDQINERMYNWGTYLKCEKPTMAYCPHGEMVNHKRLYVQSVDFLSLSTGLRICYTPGKHDASLQVEGHHQPPAIISKHSQDLICISCLNKQASDSDYDLKGRLVQLSGNQFLGVVNAKASIIVDHGINSHMSLKSLSFITSQFLKICWVFLLWLPLQFFFLWGCEKGANFPCREFNF